MPELFSALIRDPVTGETAADIAVADITVTADREAIVDFTHSFFFAGYGILVLRRQEISYVKNFFTDLRMQETMMLVFLLIIVTGLMSVSHCVSHSNTTPSLPQRLGSRAQAQPGL